MGEISDKISGVANEVAGKIKQAVGGATDREDIKADGVAQEAKGDLQKAKGDVKGTINKL